MKESRESRSVPDGGTPKPRAVPEPGPGEASALGAQTWDVAVVGSGPAGAVAAHELARLGCTVVLLDRSEFPRWKVCGACLSPGAQAALREAGLGGMPADLGALPLEILRLRGWSIQADIPLRGSLALSRKAFDTALVEAARSRGVTFVSRARARLHAVTGNAAHLRVELPDATVELSARVVVAADGLRSGILARTEGGRPVSGRDTARGGKVGLGAVFDEKNPGYGQGVIHMAVGKQGYVGLVRTEDGRLNVAAALAPAALGRSRPPQEAIAAILDEASFPFLEGEPADGWRGTPSLAYHPTRLGGERVFAVGDAAGYVEPFTGEGMSWALAGAGTLAPIVFRAVEGWREDYLEDWSRAYRGTVGYAQRLCRGAAWTLGRPLLSRAALRLLNRFPKAADPFVSRAASPPPRLAGSPL